MTTKDSILCLAVLASAFAVGLTFGWVGHKHYAWNTRGNSCPLPATTQAVMGCEIVMEQATADKWEAQDNLYRCQIELKAMKSTIECMMDYSKCGGDDGSNEEVR